MPSWSRTRRFATRSSRASATKWQRTNDCLLAITGQDRVARAEIPSSKPRFLLRLPYIEPLNLPPDRIAQRHRAGEADPRVAEGIQLSINAIATALRNSG